MLWALATGFWVKRVLACWWWGVVWLSWCARPVPQSFGGRLSRGVFINYRGVDSSGYSALLYAELSRRLGPDLVFLAGESIPAGSDYVAQLLARVRQAWVVLAVIGRRWLAVADSGGRRRLDDPDDWVRRELAEAFMAGAVVIPILVDDAGLPSERELPADIAALARCQYRRLRHREAGRDIARLVGDLVALEPGLADIEGRGPGGIWQPVMVGRPPLLADAFQPRPGLRDALLERAGVGVAGSGAVTQVLLGDGGTGKTQLAAAAFAAARGQVEVTLWVTATARAEVLSAYAEAQTAIEAVARTVPAVDAEQRANCFLTWLASTSRRWLIVLDDVLDPADLRGLWPSGPAGRVIVTTRRRDAALFARGQVVDVATFTCAEAVTYLTAKFAAGAGMPTGVLDAAAELADDLGRLPLALSHAAAAIMNDGLTCAEYRVLLADRTRPLTDILPADPAEAGDEYAYPVSGAWALARERADGLAPVGLAGRMLDVIAFLDPNGIPAAALTSRPVRDHLRGDPLRDSATDVTEEQARRALRNLRRLSLIDHAPDDEARSVRIHALAQRAGVEQLTASATVALIRVAADALTCVWPAIEADAVFGRVLRSNATVLLGRHPTALWLPDAHPLLFRLGGSLIDSGLVADAAAYSAELSATAIRLLGADHPHTFGARQILARARGEAGDPAGAASAFASLLADRIRVLGPDHLQTLATRGSLGWWRGKAGDVDGAVSVFEALLPDRLRLLGPDHPDTLWTRNNLARWQGKAGDLACSIAAFEDLLADELRVLGAEHPDTLTTRNNLAHVLGQAGRPAQAAAVVRDVLASRLRVLGPDHPRTLATREHLARWQGEAGDPGAAAAAFARILADEVRVLGANHPRTRATRARLAHWQGITET